MIRHIVILQTFALVLIHQGFCQAELKRFSQGSFYSADSAMSIELLKGIDAENKTIKSLMQGIVLRQEQKRLCDKIYNDVAKIQDTNSLRQDIDKLSQAFAKEDSIAVASGFVFTAPAVQALLKKQSKDNWRTREITTTLLSLLFCVVLILLFVTGRALVAQKKMGKTLIRLNAHVTSENQRLLASHAFNHRIVTVLAHDFRQPLVHMKHIAHLLKDYKTLTQRDVEDIIAAIEDTTGGALEIFENVLQWIRNQLTGLSAQPSLVSLRSLLEEAAGLHSGLMKISRITILNNIKPELTVEADREMLQFIHRNLLHNAIKFSPPDSTITIEADQSFGEVTVSVKDEGKGMSQRLLMSLFTAQVRPAYSNEKEKGAGIALMICKDFIEKMKGRIWASSEPGRGTIFTYALPVARMAK